MAHGAVVAGRHEKADLGLPQGFADQRHVGVDGHAECGEQVGRARARGERPVAVLGDRHAAARGDERCGSRDVECALGVAAGAAGIDGALGRVDAEGTGAHRLRAAGDLVDRLAPHAERHEEAAHL